MSIASEFREFAIKGNMVDMAVGIIIGGAFGKVVTSFVNDIIMPPLGLLVGGVHFSELSIVLKAAAHGAPAVKLNYGNWIQALMDFLLVAVAVFLMVKSLNALRRSAEPLVPKP